MLVTIMYPKIVGPNGHLSSVHLPEPGLFVAIPQRKLYMPASFTDTSKFMDTVEPLLLAKVLRAPEIFSVSL